MHITTLENGGLPQRILWPYAAIDESLADLIVRVRLVAFDFDGVFTDNTVIVSETGEEAVRCWRGDGLGLRQLEALGRAVAILSTEENAVVSVRSRKLNVRCIQGCHDKRAALEGITAELDLSLPEVAFVGNDINDLPCLEAVGLPIGVRDAHPAVLPIARLRTRTRGGCGAVREVCDIFKHVLEQ